MNIRPAGSEWLKAHFSLSHYSFTHSSFIGTSYSIEADSKGNIQEVYGPKYAPAADTPLAHLEFSLKYDDLNLDFFKAVFEKIPVEDITQFIEAAPTGKYGRKIGFFYEMLTQNEIRLNKTISGNYTNILDPEKYYTGQTAKNFRWRLNDNLLGTSAFCPMVRKTKHLQTLFARDTRQLIDNLKKNYQPDIFKRATSYLYKKETRSSYEIEHEQPSADRMERFIALLLKAGADPAEKVLEKERLVQLQNAIVDPRFANPAFRDFQNYVGENLPNGQSNVHYICPPVSILWSIMEGLKALSIKTTGVYPELRAALISFGFVFAHPFEDGNGRLHRFLIHDVLVHDGIVPEGLIIPVSAHMLSHIKEYDRALEAYSLPLMQRASYDMTEEGALTLKNPQTVNGYYKYPDLTAQSIYLIETIHATLTEDMPEELLFLQRYDEAKKELQGIVDMPDKDINRMLLFLHQNSGLFPKRRRDQFEKLTDDEIDRMQQAYRDVYEMDV